MILVDTSVWIDHLRTGDPLLTVHVATDSEVLFFIERHKLMGQGIGYIDVHLLAAAVLDGTAQLWTRDKRLCSAAEKLKLTFKVL